MGTKFTLHGMPGAWLAALWVHLSEQGLFYVRRSEDLGLRDGEVDDVELRNASVQLPHYCHVGICAVRAHRVSEAAQAGKCKHSSQP